MITFKLNKLGFYDDIFSRKYEYGHCRLFIKHEHDLITPSSDSIQVCKNDKNCRTTLKFNRVGSYKSLKLRSVVVYFNRFDSNFENPLILVFIFNNALRDAPNRFYRSSGIDNDLTSSHNLSDIIEYKEEQALLKVLLEENDKITEPLTFDIWRTKGDSPPKGNNIKYNGNKISIVNDSRTLDLKLSEGGFAKYKHTPHVRGKLKKFCFLYNNNPLFQENGTILSNIQITSDGYINVYMSSKADVHVLLEIVYPKTQTKNEFYCHNMTSRLFWEKLDNKNFEKYTGHNITSRDNIYQQLTSAKNSKLLQLLKKLEDNLLKISFFLVDIFNGKYGETDVKDALGNYNPRLLGSRNKVSVVDISNDVQVKCLSNEGFRVYEHNFDDVVRFVPVNQQVRLKFIRSNVEDTNFDFITIYIDKVTSTSYMYGSHKIEVTENSNLNFKYKWIRHSCERDIFNTKFRVQFKDQSATFNFEKSIIDLNPKVLFVYFNTDNFDVFVLLVFTSNAENKIWYMNYLQFKNNVSNEKPIELSSLLTESATTKSENIGSQRGYSGSWSDRSLDSPIKNLLDQERVKHCVIYIQLDNNNQLSYNSGLVIINVSEQDNRPFNGYKTFNHSFSSKINFYDICIIFKGQSKMLDITSQFDNQKITSVSIYFHTTYPTTPLMICLSSDNHVNKYFNYSVFVYNSDTTVKLSDLKLIPEHEIQPELQSQYKNLTSNITFDPFSTEDYTGFDVSPLKPYGNYKYYIHTPSQCFNHIELKNTGLYELEGFRNSDYTYKNLLNIFIYYHSFDKDNSYPLIIQVSTKNVQVLPKPKGNESNKDEYKVDYINILYCLSEIDSNTFKKTYKKTGSSNKSLTSMLNETYTKLKGKININFGDSGSDIIDNLLYSTGNNSLYVCFHKSDPRPLAFCYENKAYKRYFIDEQSSKWVSVPGFNRCLCSSDGYNKELLNVLKELSVSLGLIKAEGSVQKKVLETPIKIDLSRTETATYGDSNNIRVSPKMSYGHCDLFCFCTHSISTLSAFKITSFIRPYGLNKTINMNEPVDNVLSVNVYFNIYASDKPVLLEFIIGDGKKRYLKGLDREESSSDSSSIIEFNETQFVDDLIEENDRINNRLTYKIDKTNPYNNINITPSTKTESGFTMYRHSPKDQRPKMSNVLNNKRMLVGRTTNKVKLIEDIQNKVYNDITVYWLDINSEYPILVQFNQPKVSTYIFKKDQNGLYWKSDIFSYKDPLTTRNKLDEIFYSLKNSVIIEINNIGQFEKNYSYEIKHIDNMPNSDGLTPKTSRYEDAKKIGPDKKIHVSDETSSFSYLGDTSFKCYKHDLSELKGTSVASDISGIRLFLKNPGLTNPFEIELYDNSSAKKNRTFLYYTPGFKDENKNEVYVYFYNQDFRPLLLCFKGDLYRRIDNNKNVDWYKDPKIKCSVNQNIQTTLKEVYNSMKKKMIFVTDGQIEKINTSRNENFGTFRKDSFTPKYSGGNDQKFKIPKSELIGQQRAETTNIANLLDELNSKPFDSINVYRTEGQSIQDILLLEFINDLQRIYFKRIDEVGKYWVEESISDHSSGGLQKKLKTIKSDITETVIYEIDSTQTNYNSNIDILNVPGQPTSEFSKWTHTPRKVTHKKSLFLCGKKKLMRKLDSGYRELSEINVNKYNSVSVYFGRRAKDGSNNLPLIIELIKHPSKPDSSIFYQHKREGTNHYWESVSIDNKTDNKLTLKLKEVEFRLVDSLLILLEKNIGDKEYGENDVSNSFTNLHLKEEINRFSMRNNKKIQVIDKTNSNGQCVQKFGYKVVCHNIEQVTNGLGGEGQPTVGIRFLIPNDSSDEKYKQLMLYNENKTEPQYMEYIYYDGSHKEVYVYFYGDDPRPLLVTYNGNVYKPKDKERYFSHWVKVKGVYECHQGEDNYELIKNLSMVVGFLNEVRLKELPKKITILNPNKRGNLDETITYDTYKFKGQKIEIKVSYENKSCYRVYHHESNGLGSNGSGFRLGNINYDNKVANGIDYSIFNELLSVSLYYSIYDKSHQYPLLVVLKFNRNCEEYYELDDNREIKWQQLKGYIDSKNIEKTAYNIRSRLNITYNDTQKQRKLFDDKECKEDQVDVPAVAGGTVGGLAGAGAIGGGGYLLYAKVIFTATSVAPS